MKLSMAPLQIKQKLMLGFQYREFELNDSLTNEYVNLSQSSFRGIFRSPCAQKWRANCDTLWTAAMEIKNRRGRRFVDIRGNIRACRSSRRRANTHAASIDTSLEKHRWPEQKDVRPRRPRDKFLLGTNYGDASLKFESKCIDRLNFKYARVTA